MIGNLPPSRVVATTTHPAVLPPKSGRVNSSAMYIRLEGMKNLRQVEVKFTGKSRSSERINSMHAESLKCSWCHMIHNRQGEAVKRDVDGIQIQRHAQCKGRSLSATAFNYRRSSVAIVPWLMRWKFTVRSFTKGHIHLHHDFDRSSGINGLCMFEGIRRLTLG